MEQTHVTHELLELIADSYGGWVSRGNHDRCAIYSDYSGRGMFGARCVGFCVSDPFALGVAMGDVINSGHGSPDLTQDERNIIEGMIADVNQDSLGYDAIVYFPSFITDHVDEDDDDEED